MNANTIPIPTAARTATTVSPRLRNLHHSGVLITVVVSAASGTGGLTLHVRGYDGKAGNSYDLFADAAPITATGTYAFLIAPSTGAASAGVRGAVSRPVPKYWDIQVVTGDASSYTYTVNAQLLNR